MTQQKPSAMGAGVLHQHFSSGHIYVLMGLLPPLWTISFTVQTTLQPPCGPPAAPVSWAGCLLSLLGEALPGEQCPGRQEDTVFGSQKSCGPGGRATPRGQEAQKQGKAPCYGGPMLGGCAAFSLPDCPGMGWRGAGGILWCSLVARGVCRGSHFVSQLQEGHERRRGSWDC